MNSYEIYWNDLTPEAQAKFARLYHDNIDLAPLAIIDIEEEVDRTKVVKLLWRDKSGRGLPPEEITSTIGDLEGYAPYDANDQDIDTNDDGLTLWEWADQAEPGDKWDSGAEEYILIAVL